MTVKMNESNSWFPEMHQRLQELESERDALKQQLTREAFRRVEITWRVGKILAGSGTALSDGATFEDTAREVVRLQQRVRELEAQVTLLTTKNDRVIEALEHVRYCRECGESDMRHCDKGKFYLGLLDELPAETPESERRT